MRYLEGQAPDLQYTHTEGMEIILMFPVVLSLLVGIALLWLSIRGRVLWLKVWSVGLVLCSITYLVYSSFF